MKVYQKRGVWYLIEEGKDVRLFSSEEEAKAAYGWVSPVEESLDGSTKEEEGSEEEASTDEQTFVFGSEGSGKEEV